MNLLEKKTFGIKGPKKINNTLNMLFCFSETMKGILFVEKNIFFICSGL